MSMEVRLARSGILDFNHLAVVYRCPYPTSIIPWADRYVWVPQAYSSMLATCSGNVPELAFRGGMYHPSHSPRVQYGLAYWSTAICISWILQERVLGMDLLVMESDVRDNCYRVARVRWVNFAIDAKPEEGVWCQALWTVSIFLGKGVVRYLNLSKINLIHGVGG